MTIESAWGTPRIESPAPLSAVLMTAVLGLCVSAAQAQDAGKAMAAAHGDGYAVSNATVELGWTVSGEHLSRVVFTDKPDHSQVNLTDPFALLLKDGTILNADNLRVTGPPEVHALEARPEASRYSERVAGQEIDTNLVDASGDVRISWAVVLRNGSEYVRQVVTIHAGARDLPILKVQMLDLRLPGAHVVGSVKGSPVVAGNMFMGFEDPLSDSKVRGDRVSADAERELPLKAGQSVSYASVMGVAPAGQMRRAVLNYVERERAHPYRTFLHYNSWYDLGFFNTYDAQGALDRVNAFGRELHEKRGVTLDSYLFDDGWDNHASLWNFHAGFPQGFTPIKEAAQRYGAAPGVWLSPWGGYGKPKQDRVNFGRQAGYEIVDNGFALSGPKYYARFRDVCMEMIRKYGVNQFKIDGTGNADSVFRGSAFDSDFAAAVHLIGELREAKPDIYINLSTGTYPSPFWLLYADSIWRGGDDDGFAGVGSNRERWITYRDADTYEHIVKAGPLFPINSLMLHGMIYARQQKQLNQDPGNDFRNEVRSYFGTGTQLQEMYITPSLLTSQNWDDLAEAAKWSRSHAEVLKDSHWIGGDPAWLEAYGWASWNAGQGIPSQGILVLRNPSDKPQTIRVDIADAFELPPGAPQTYRASSPWKDDAGKPAITLEAHHAHEFQLAPFEVLTLDAASQ